MSYRTGMSGLELFGTPFSTSVKADGKRRQTGVQHKGSQSQPSKTRTHKIEHEPQKPSVKTQPTEPRINPAIENAAVTQEKTNTEKPQFEKTVQESSVKGTSFAGTKTAAAKKELTIDLSSGSGREDTERRRAHEEAEAKHRAEWEARKEAKKQAENAALQELSVMNEKDAVSAALERVNTDMERLTRRNMKECVATHIRELCCKDAKFAKATMHPRKNMVKCFRYINRMAKEYVKQEMEENGIQPDGNGYGCDVPDGLCYQWAQDYFNAADALEDREKEETFVPKPYIGPSAGKASKTAKSKKNKTKKQQKTSGGYEQLTLEGVME